MSGITIIPDTGVEFESGAAEYISTAKLDDTHFIVAYRDVGDSNKGKVVVGTIAGTVITVSADDIAEFELGEAIYTSVAVLSSSLFVISYMDDSDGDKIKVIAGTVSGTTVTLGSIVEVSAHACQHTSIAAFDNTYFVVIYYDGTDNNVYGKAGSISGTTITLGSEYLVDDLGNDNNPVSVATFNGTKFVTANTQGLENYNHLMIRIGTLTPATKVLSFGTATAGGGTLSRVNADRGIVAPDSLHFIIFQTRALPNHCYVGVGTYNESTSEITLGEQLESEIMGIGSICAMGSTHFIISYYSLSDEKGYVRACSMAEDMTLTWDEAAVKFESDIIYYYYVGICNMKDDSYFLTGFKDTSGKVIAGTYIPPGVIDEFSDELTNPNIIIS